MNTNLPCRISRRGCDGIWRLILRKKAVSARKERNLLLEEKKSIYVKPRTILVLLGDAREPGAKA